MIQFMLIALAINVEAEYYTNTNYVYDMAGLGGTLYCATNGGLVAFDATAVDFRVVTNTDGLQKNQQNCVGLDSSGSIWVGNDMGLALVESSLDAVHIYPVDRLASTRITTIACRRDSIYVGSSNGLLFIDTRGTANDFSDDHWMKRFEVPSYSITSIAVDDTSLWVGTTDGVSQLTRDLRWLLRNYTVDDGLLANEINDVVLVDTVLYVATDAGLNRFAAGHFDTLVIDRQVNMVCSLRDSIILGLDQSQQVGLLTGSTVTLIRDGLPWYSRVLCLFNLDEELFCGLGNAYVRNYHGDGIGRYDDINNLWTTLKNQCLPSNHIDEITANESGIFVACGARSNESKGMGWLTNTGGWVNFSTDSVLPSNHVHRCATGPGGKVWLGYNAFPDATSSVMLSCLDPSDSTWLDIHNRYNGMEGTEAVWDIEFDDQSNMYLALGRPTDKLWVIDSSLQNVYYLSPQTTEFRIEIALDSSGVVWQTHPATGISMIDTRGTLFDRSDDIYHNFTTADGLISNYMGGCTVDRNNTMYATADQGLVSMSNGVLANRTDVSDSALLDVEIDANGLLWILARDGVHCMESPSDTVFHWRFASHNIDMKFLESIGEITQVQGFEFDPVRRCLWIGGESGLLRLDVTYETDSPVGAATVFPNPAYGDTIRIKDLPPDGRVDIYTISGRVVVRDLAPAPGELNVIWQIPDDITSGMYFALVRSAQGNKAYKFAVIR